MVPLAGTSVDWRELMATALRGPSPVALIYWFFGDGYVTVTKAP